MVIQKWLCKVIFTGGIGKNSNISDSSVARNFAVQKSVSIENIFIEEISKITSENIFYAKKIIEENNFDKIILVSDPLHMKRSMTIARDYNLNVYSSPTPTTRYISLKAKIGFLFYELFFYILHQLYKFLFIITLYAILFLLIFSIYCVNIFRHNCA